MVRRIKWMLAFTAMAVLTVGALAAPTFAAASGTSSADRVAVAGNSTVALNGAQEDETAGLAACNGVPVSAYGYLGCAKSGTDALHCGWDEWFVIAPDRTIWHAWPNSGGWKQMPNNGRADNTWDCYVNGNGQHQVEVYVNGSGVWYSYLSGSGWKGWYKR